MFAGAPRLSSLLRYVVEETLSNRADGLKEYALGVAVLGRSSSFDPRLDSIVRVEASKLRARLVSYYKGDGADDPILVELRPGSYIPRFTVRGEPSPNEPRPQAAIAVLPFVPLGPEAEIAYLADGVAEEIIDRLGFIPGLSVVARTSSFQLKAKNATVQEIGQALGAGYLLEGSVRKSDGHLRVIARLIDAKTGYRLWSRAFDKQLDDVFGIQIAIADGIVVALSLKQALPPVSRGREIAAEPYFLYLKGRFHRNEWTLEGFEKSVECLHQALRQNPNSSQILAALAEVETNKSLLSGTVSNAKQIEQARAYAEQALRLDAHCAQAHLSLGWIHQLYDWQWQPAQEEYDRALALNPSFAEAWHLRGLSLAIQQRVGGADESFRRAIEVDPLSPIIRTHSALVPYFSGDLAEAESRVRAALISHPQVAEPHWVLGLILERRGAYSEAADHLRTAIRFGGDNPVILADLAFVYTRVGDFESARQIKSKLEAGFPRPHPAASNLARVCFGLGELDLSTAWLDEAFEARDFMLPWACVDPRYESFWKHPQICQLRERIVGTNRTTIAAVG